MSKTILLIEDEADIREVYTEVLQDSGFSVIACADGEVGMETALSQPWDLLLLDIMLPKKDGIEILSGIKAHDSVKSRPVILLSNLEKSEILDACLGLGAQGYLIKSNITPDTLVQEVQRNLPDAV